MKDRLGHKAVADFFDVLADLREGLAEKGMSSEWCSDVLKDEHACYDTRRKHVQAWVDALTMPLVRGSAKYRTAVTSIISSPAVAYHALKYRDAGSMEEASGLFKGMLVGRCADAAGDAFWEYLDEMTEYAFRAARQTVPRVPGPDEIASDIAKRKRDKQREPEAVLNQGAYDILCGLYHSRQATPPDNATFNEKMLVLMREHELTSDRCKAGDCEAQILEQFGELGPLQSSDWEQLTKMFALSTMENAIPGKMMKGIEEVAAQLVSDITSGKAAMNSLNIEDIGQRVLSNVSSSDVDAFAHNIDKILPAINNINLQGMGGKP